MLNRLDRTWIIVGIVTMFALIVGVVGALPVRSQDTPQNPHHVIQSTVAETISYQGMLTDNAGDPVPTGSYPMRFELFEQASGGAPVFDSGALSVEVNDGLFSIGLNDVPQSVFDGRPLYLAITVDGETLSPRQEIRPAPYAMSLRPGATVRQEATGAAVRVESTLGVGLHGTGRVYGVYGTNAGATQGSGYGGYFESSTGIGVSGRSTAESSQHNRLAPGVYGHSEWGVGVLGQAATGFGVLGTTAGSGIGGVGQVYGVYGASEAPAQGQGYGGYFVSSTGIGVSGRSTALISGNNLYAPGVYGYSTRGAGVMGEAGLSSSVAGLFLGDVLIDGDLIVTGTKSGYVVDIARNDGDAPLRRGDLVVVTGVTAPVIGGIPTPLVRRADVAASTAVIGIVDQAYHPGENGIGRFDDGPVNPGDYLSIVTMGAFAFINADASYGAIQPGDLLVSSPTPGHAMRADDPRVGTVIGKALEALDDGLGVIAVMVTLQ